MSIPATLEAAPKPGDLRERLLGELRNIELRQKYLATRTAAWAQADLQLARERLLAARIVRGIVGLGLVGAIGGIVGQWLLPAADGNGIRALPIIVGVGSIIAACVAFALLGSVGCVVLPEVVGEERPVSRGRGAGAVLGQVWESQMEAACGGIWGGVCGLFIGLLTFAVDLSLGLPLLGASGAPVAGAIGGVLLGVIFGWIVIRNDRRHGPSNSARSWAGLGPLPIAAYLFSISLARKHFLGK